MKSDLVSKYTRLIAPIFNDMNKLDSIKNGNWERTMEDPHEIDTQLYLDDLEDRLEALLEEGKRRLEVDLDEITDNILASLPDSFHLHDFIRDIEGLVNLVH